MVIIVMVWEGVLGAWEIFPTAYLDFEVHIAIIVHSASLHALLT